MGKKSKSPLKTAKVKAWKLFSEYIRRGSADSEGYASCVTCGDRKRWQDLSAGHFIDSRNNTVLFDEELVYPQCYRCNVILSGNKVKYTLYMLSQGHSKDQIEEFCTMKHKTKKVSLYEYEELITKYKIALTNLDLIKDIYG